MARPKMQRICYTMPEPSVTVTDESVAFILERAKELGYDSRIKLANATGISEDKIRHFKDGHYLRLSELKQLVERLGIKAILEEV